MKALISTTEIFNYQWVSSWEENDKGQWQPVYSEIIDCQRVTEVVPNDQTFDVYHTLIWVDCPEDCVADQWYYKDGVCSIKLQDVSQPNTPTLETAENGEPGVIA